MLGQWHRLPSTIIKNSLTSGPCLLPTHNCDRNIELIHAYLTLHNIPYLHIFLKQCIGVLITWYGDSCREPHSDKYPLYDTHEVLTSTFAAPVFNVYRHCRSSAVERLLFSHYKRMEKSLSYTDDSSASTTQKQYSPLSITSTNNKNYYLPMPTITSSAVWNQYSFLALNSWS